MSYYYVYIRMNAAESKLELLKACSMENKEGFIIGPQSLYRIFIRFVSRIFKIHVRHVMHDGSF